MTRLIKYVATHFAQLTKWTVAASFLWGAGAWGLYRSLPESMPWVLLLAILLQLVLAYVGTLTIVCSCYLCYHRHTYSRIYQRYVAFQRWTAMAPLRRVYTRGLEVMERACEDRVRIAHDYVRRLELEKQRLITAMLRHDAQTQQTLVVEPPVERPLDLSEVLNSCMAELRINPVRSPGSPRQRFFEGQDGRPTTTG